MARTALPRCIDPALVPRWLFFRGPLDAVPLVPLHATLRENRSTGGLEALHNRVPKLGAVSVEAARDARLFEGFEVAWQIHLIDMNAKPCVDNLSHPIQIMLRVPVVPSDRHALGW